MSDHHVNGLIYIILCLSSSAQSYHSKCLIIFIYQPFLLYAILKAYTNDLYLALYSNYTSCFILHFSTATFFFFGNKEIYPNLFMLCFSEYYLILWFVVVIILLSLILSTFRTWVQSYWNIYLSLENQIMVKFILEYYLHIYHLLSFS